MSVTLDQLIDVYEDSVIFHVPNGDPIIFDDLSLEHLFDYPEFLYEHCSSQSLAGFLEEVIPHIMRIRNRKRDLYAELGFYV